MGRDFFLSNPTRIVYANRMKDIYTLPPTGGSPTNLTNNLYSAAINTEPVFSPDGNKMAYLTIPNKDATGLSWGMGFWVMNKDGLGKKEILSWGSDVSIDEVIWSPDGNWIAYSYNDWNNAVYGIYKISPDGGTPIPIVTSTTSRFAGPTYSADGKDIAYVYDGGQSGECGIYTIGVDSLVTATIISSSTGEFYNNPTYSPDGNYIAYVYYGLQNEHEYNGLYVAPSDGSSSWPVYDNWIEGFCWSPDSTKLALYTEERADLGNSYHVNLDGSNLTRLNETNTFSIEGGGIDWSSQNVIAYNQNLDIWIKQLSDKPTLQITTIFLPDGSVSSSYSQTLTAAGGISPYTWSNISGSLPPGLNLNSSGAISGTPTTATTTNFTVQATDSSSQSDTQSLSITIKAPVKITTTSLPNGQLETAYSQTLTATGGTPPYTWSIISGSLPAGLSLNGSTGKISGTATTIGTSSFTVQVQDSDNPAQTDTQDLSLIISAVPLDRIEVLPGTVNLQVGETRAFIVTGYDQNNNPMNPPIIPIWTATGGTITQDGSYTAATEGDFTVTISVEGSGVTGTATVYVATSKEEVPPGQTNVVAAALDSTSVEILDNPHQDTVTLTINTNPEEANFVIADQNLPAGVDISGLTAAVREFKLFKDGQEITEGRFKITLPYPETISDEKAQDLRIFRMNPDTNRWELVGGTVNTTEHTVTVEVDHLSIFRVAYYTSVANDFSNVRVYPNPFKPYDGNDETGNYSRGIIFDQLTENAAIKIFNLAGELVNELSGTGEIRWDARNKEGKEVASGVYIYLVTDKAGNKPATGKFVIIR
ncbi:putative Ig domain-containing protein [bacterium]|nr:putative Ig domain-containing protein [bacterium]